MGSSNPFYVLVVYFMPVYSQPRLDLFRKFIQHIQSFQFVVVYLLQAVFQDQQFIVTQPDNPTHFRYRCNTKLWLKENLLNILLQKLPTDAKYVAWIDADLHFHNPNFVLQAKQLLKKHQVIQLFQDSQFLGQQGQVLHTAKSFMYYASGFPNFTLAQLTKTKDKYPHPGYAWAAQYQYLIRIGGFYQNNVIGSADKLMAFATIGDWQSGLQENFKLSSGFINNCKEWSLKAKAKSIGFVKGKISHGFHGLRQDRSYVSRWGILERYNFDPYLHLQTDQRGILRFSKECPAGLIEQINQYFIDRKDNYSQKLQKYSPAARIPIPQVSVPTTSLASQIPTQPISPIWYG